MKFLGGIAVAIASLLLSPASAHSKERNPLRNVGHITDPVLQTPSHRVHAYSSFQVTFALSDTASRIRLSLEPNHDVVADGATVTYLNRDGSIQRAEPIDRLDHRVFKGTAFVKYPGDIEWTNAGWARIHVLKDGPSPVFEGAFALNGNHHHVQTNGHYQQTRLSKDPEIKSQSDDVMIVWRDSDIISDASMYPDLENELKRSVQRDTCASGELLFNRDENHPIYRGIDTGKKRSIWSAMSPRALFGRQIDGTTGGSAASVNLTAAIGSTAGCPTSRKVALIGVATDCTYTADFDNETAVRTNIINQVNMASQLYETTFDISLGIQNLTISPKDCPSTASAEVPWNIACDGRTLADRLNAFSEWRGQHNDTNAYWTLMSTCNTDSAVGLAWLGQLCMSGSTAQGNETIAAANVVVRTSTEWQVFAHESGHTFGAVHDCTSQTCADGSASMQQCCPLSTSSCDADGQFLMNPSTSSGITLFSQCSIGNICSALGRQSVQSSCLTSNKNVVTITGSQCGNGIVESGEECDCGGEAACADNTCCDATTCKLTTGSVCDSSNEECCTSSCQFAGSDTVCRASNGVCDPQETCTGNSSICPADVSAADGTDCGSSLQCASGQCTSRDQQCQTFFMGSLTTENVTESCGSSGCQISCQSPSLPNTCYVPGSNFLDGTPCQGAGKCSNGNCEGSNAGEEIKSWIEENKNIVIPVACVIGGLIVIAVCSCIWSTIRRSQARRRHGLRAKGYGYVPSAPPMGGPGSVPGGGSRSHHQSRSSRSSRPSRGTMPLPQGPPPAYNGYQQNMPTRYA